MSLFICPNSLYNQPIFYKGTIFLFRKTTLPLSSFPKVSPFASPEQPFSTHRAPTHRAAEVHTPGHSFKSIVDSVKIKLSIITGSIILHQLYEGSAFYDPATALLHR